MVGDESSLLRRCEHDHAELLVGMESRENPIVHPEIRVAHVGAFDHTVQGHCHTPEISWSHLGSYR